MALVCITQCSLPETNLFDIQWSHCSSKGVIAFITASPAAEILKPSSSPVYSFIFIISAPLSYLEFSKNER